MTIAGQLDEIQNDAFTGICVSNVTIEMSAHKKELPWNCTDVSGVTSNVSPPTPCELLPKKEKFECPFPTDKLTIENVEFKTCNFKSSVIR